MAESARVLEANRLKIEKKFNYLILNNVYMNISKIVIYKKILEIQITFYTKLFINKLFL